LREASPIASCQHPTPEVNVVSILDAWSGRVLRTVDVPDPWGLAVDRRIGVAFITDEDNPVSVLDLHSGAVVRTLPGP
jgi:DNA-binding beta-propeller fold protein YncE